MKTPAFDLSHAHEARARRFTPSGSQTLSKRPDAFPTCYPKYCATGTGPYLYDVDGHRYLDWIGSLGATPLGYAHPKIVEAVAHQLCVGSLFSLPHVKEAEVAEQLVDVIPCAEMIRFTKTGSEACAAAVAIARAATGRDVILCDASGYHGWHDGFRVLAKSHPGVPDTMQGLIRTFVYGDATDLLDVIETAEADGHRVAALILEPARLTPPAAGYLDRVVELAHEHGALVIFDELILGGRLALAGGQEYFAVTPDLATFGKAFGAGLPLAFVAGRRELMEHAWPISGTYSGDTLALAACEAMLRIYRDEDVVARLWQLGTALQQGFRDAGFTVRGYPPHFGVECPPVQSDPRVAMSVFVQECAARGVLFHPAVINACAAMTEAHLDETLSVVSNVAYLMTHSRPEELLVGRPYADSVRS